MKNGELCKKLREISRSTPSAYKKQICKQAARRIEEQAATLKKAMELLQQLEKILPSMAGGCDLCDHRDPIKPCIEKDELIQCKECPYGCYCQDCTPDGSKWENSVLKEVLRGIVGNDG